MKKCLCSLLLLLPMISAQTAQAVLVKVTIENLAPTDGTLLTPLWVGFHNGSFDLYDIGAAATPGLETLAESGNTAPLSGEFLGSGFGTVDGTILGPTMPPFAPGEMSMTTFDIDGTDAANRYFSYASMVIPSNDAFIANGGETDHEIFDADGNFLGAEFIILGTAVRDAGTELNDELPENTAALAQANPDDGISEGGVVSIHPGFLTGGNILAAIPAGDFTLQGYQIARITITDVTPAPNRAIPEPITGALGLMSLGVLGLASRRRLLA